MIKNLDTSEPQTRQVWFEEVGFPVLPVKQVSTNDNGSQGVRSLVSSVLTVLADDCLKLFISNSSCDPFPGNHRNMGDHGCSR